MSESFSAEIVITDGGERSWALYLRFNKISDTFYISRGWRSFYDENCKRAGSLFVFRLVGNGEVPLLSFSPAESRGDKSCSKESLPVESIEKNYLTSRDSTPPSQNRFVTLTFTHDTELNCRQVLDPRWKMLQNEAVPVSGQSNTSTE
ncbi:hypothetical protein AALP_AA6G267500 [Arabis alpina]|uniref:TF-B3 domain-containing protein n=1 Tax=Arabis alpina TaxID=50452 RepID=A0A087GRX0_ARAAL|nr:hypothetical protein AALP_AA6G267500 [Arabis alpina]